MPQLPVGNQDFKSIRDNGFYYVDKSMLIAQILDGNSEEVSLFTRPRRFGKSLNLSMLDAFLNMDYAGNRWFEGLEISRHREYDEHMNAYPVVKLDFKGLDLNNTPAFKDSVRRRIRPVVERHEYLSESERIPTGTRASIAEIARTANPDFDPVEALEQLVFALRAHHDRKVVILIDEYDDPLNSSYGTPVAEGVRTYMSRLLTSVLKGNENVKTAVITGVMQIAKESIFSGLNNLDVNNILSCRSDEMFGFTDEEVKRICTDYGHPERYAQAKEWYDGYRFGDADVYNPWSVLKYVKEGFRPDTYWASTSGNDIISTLLDNADGRIYEDLEILARGGSVGADIDASVVYSDLKNCRETIYSVMATAGYLKVIRDGADTVVALPDRELFSVFAKEILRRAAPKSGSTRAFIDATLCGDVDTMTRLLHRMILETLGIRMLGREIGYHAFLTGMLMSAAGRYEITADHESGDGFHDIRMRRIRGDTPNVVIEVKRATSPESLRKEAESALSQIHERRYYEGMHGWTVLYGIAFHGKTPEVVCESLKI